ncbi:MAG: sn-glycerol-3-phosphate ABC transporter ATP-binding protein UgpC [Thermoleophilia bacterium]|nr:sn-glycerol-3-phosphate ABC transporter ATP-binding protein UgpC [Thermoleophilia bacterium]
MSDIVLDHVTKRYGDGYEAVKDMSLEIKDGEFMILVGPSGCGKSTALQMIAGLEDITEGDLKIGGNVVNNLAPKDRDIAMVFQNYALYPHMSVRENMGFALKLAKVDKEVINQKVEDAAKTLDLTEHLDRRPANLSGGQRQRVAMGRAIVRDPQAFLMDEPLSNLDAKLRVQTRTEVSKLQSRLGTTTVYVTHDQTEAMTLGDRVAVMRAGELQQVGTPAELYNEPLNLFVAGFIGSPAMNFTAATVSGDSVKLPFVDVPLSDELKKALGEDRNDRKVIAGLRPGNFEDANLIEEAEGGVHFETEIDLIESMGSELFAYFTADHDKETVEKAAAGSGLEELSGGDTSQMVARLDAASEIKRGDTAKLWLDPAKLVLFDPESGKRIAVSD